MWKKIIRCSLMLVASLCIFGCKRQHSNYCPGALNDNCLNVDAPVEHCTSDQACAPEVCDLAGSKTCVQCTTQEASACTGTTPVCGADDACRGCAAHAECGSNACLPDGSCGTDTNVAYVDPLGVDNAMCSKAMPCKKVMAALATNKPYVKFHGLTDEAVTVDLAGAVTFLADPGARLTRTSNGLLLEIRGASQVAIYDLEISGASGMNNPGISMPTGNTATLMLTRVTISNNSGGGISAFGGMLTVTQSTISGNTGGGGGISASGGTLTVTQSTISGNTGGGGGISASGGTLTVTQSTISGNTGGGVSISGAQFAIANCFIVQNGGPLSLVGGIDISQIPLAGGSRLEFNTITANTGNTSINSGINCATVVVPLVFNNNIIYGNMVSGGGMQLGGSAMCSAAYSDVGPGATTGSNINADPMFVNASQGNFHLMSNSPAKDAADPNATLAIDFDGQTRPQGPRRDMGADEIAQ